MFGNFPVEEEGKKIIVFFKKFLKKKNINQKNKKMEKRYLGSKGGFGFSLKTIFFYCFLGVGLIKAPQKRQFFFSLIKIFSLIFF